MKRYEKQLVLLVYGAILPFLATAQDSTRTTTAPDSSRTSYTGIRVWSDVGLLENNSLTDIRQRLQQTGLDASGIGNRPYTVGFSFLRDQRKSITETRLIFATSSDYDPTSTNAIDKQATFFGYGIGAATTYKVVNTRRFIIGPTLGYEFMWYRLRILPQNGSNLSINNVVTNPAFYNTVTLRQGVYFNIHGAVSADYRLNWFKKIYREFRIGTRVGYQLPLVRSTKWRYGDGTVGDLPGFKSNTLSVQFGVTILPRPRTRYDRSYRSRT